MGERCVRCSRLAGWPRLAGRNGRAPGPSVPILPAARTPKARRGGAGMSDKGDGLVNGEPGAVGGGETSTGNGAGSELNGDLPFSDSEELRTLISQGRERGYLTFEQIAGTLEEVEVTKEQVQHLHAYLIEHGVDVIAENGLTAYKEAKEGNQPGQTKKPELDLTVEPSLDSLRLYLRSIGRVDLLTADEEIALAKRIERG